MSRLTLVQLRVIQAALAAGFIAGASWIASAFYRLLRVFAEYGTSHPTVFRPGMPSAPVPVPATWQVVVVCAALIAILIAGLFVTGPAAARAKARTGAKP